MTSQADEQTHTLTEEERKDVHAALRYYRDTAHDRGSAGYHRMQALARKFTSRTDVLIAGHARVVAAAAAAEAAQ